MLDFLEDKDIQRLEIAVRGDVPDYDKYTEHEKVAIIMNWIWLSGSINGRVTSSLPFAKWTYWDYTKTIFIVSTDDNEDLIIWKPDSWFYNQGLREDIEQGVLTQEEYEKRKSPVEEILYDYAFNFLYHTLGLINEERTKLYNCGAKEIVIISDYTHIPVKALRIFEKYVGKETLEKIHIENVILNDCGDDYMRAIGRVQNITDKIKIKQKALLMELLDSKYSNKLIMDYLVKKASTTNNVTEEELGNLFEDYLKSLIPETETEPDEYGRPPGYLDPEEKEYKNALWLLAYLQTNPKYTPGVVTRWLNSKIKEASI